MECRPKRNPFWDNSIAKLYRRMKMRERKRKREAKIKTFHRWVMSRIRHANTKTIIQLIEHGDERDIYDPLQVQLIDCWVLYESLVFVTQMYCCCNMTITLEYLVNENIYIFILSYTYVDFIVNSLVVSFENMLYEIGGSEND